MYTTHENLDYEVGSLFVTESKSELLAKIEVIKIHVLIDTLKKMKDANDIAMVANNIALERFKLEAAVASFNSGIAYSSPYLEN